MQIQVSASDLAIAIRKVKSIISAKNFLPILSNVLLTERGGKFYLTASNSESELTVNVNISVLKGPFHPVCLPTTFLCEAASTLGSRPLSMDFTEIDNHSYNVNVSHISGHFSFVAMSHDEFPLMRNISDNERVLNARMPEEMVAVMATACNFAQAEDTIRPQMCGVNIDFRNAQKNSPLPPEDIVIVATDGHSLFKHTRHAGTDLAVVQPSPCNVIVHRANVRPLYEAARGLGEISVESDNRVVRFSADNGEESFSFTMSLPGGAYPNYDTIIPEHSPYSLSLNRAELLSVIKRVSLFASVATSQVVLRNKNGKLQISAEDIDMAHATVESMDITEGNIPDNFAISFKSKTIIKILSLATTENVTLNLTAPDRPVVVRDDNPNSVELFIAMPMLINQ